MSCSFDSDKWPHPSNMNFAADRGGGRGGGGLPTEITSFVQGERMIRKNLKFNAQVSAS